MDVDWFTLIAQIVNFLILVFLLKHFLYGPITNAMKKREEDISSKLKEAREEKESAEKEKARFEQKQTALEEDREKIFSDARTEAENQKKRLMRQTRDEVDEIGRKWRQAIEKEKEGFLKDLRHRATGKIYQAVKKALSELAESDLESRMIRAFTGRLQNLDEEKKQAILDTLEESRRGLLVRTAFPMSEDQKRDVSNAVKDAFSRNVPIEFEVNRDIVCGIEIRADGRKIAWNIADYLQDLEHDLFLSLKETHEKEETKTPDDSESPEEI